MSETDFFDTNVLLNLLSPDVTKSERAEDLLADRGTVSIQVLDEFASVATRKFRMSMKGVRDTLGIVRRICTVEVADIETHELGLDIAERYKLSVYDSMLLAAAIKAKCTTFYSEDLQNGFKLDGLTIRNPFTC